MRGYYCRAIVAGVLCLGGLCGISSTTATAIAATVETTATAPEADKRSKFWQAERIDRGFIVILPGSWGETAADHGIVDGLINAQIDSAIEMYAWPIGEFPSGILMVPYNLRATKRNREQAREVVAKIVRYQKQYPGRPVHLIGYSGGGGIAVWALEALPAETKISSAILLAPTLSSSYDLGPALSRTQHGIHNFYSQYDVPIMMAACSIVGTTDGTHGLAGGAVGFRPSRSADATQRELHASHLHQHPYTLSMLEGGHTGGHYGWTRHGFIAAHVAPLIDPTAARSSLLR